MKRPILLAVILVLLAAAPGWGAVTVGSTTTLFLLPGSFTFAVPVTSTAADMVAGLNFAIQIGDGGVENGGANTTPTITAVDITTLFPPSSYNPPISNHDLGKLIWFGNITMTGANSVEANGTLALVTVNVAPGLATPTKFDVKLKDVWTSVWGTDLFTDFATSTGQSITPTWRAGAIVALPGPHTMTWRGSLGNNWTAANWDDSFTYPAGITAPTYPDLTADAVIGGGMVTVDVAAQANSVTVNNSGALVVPADKSLTVANQVTVAGGGTLTLPDGAALTASAVQLDGGSVSVDGILGMPITIGSAGAQIQSTTSLTFNGAISGSGALAISGATLVLGQSNSYAGGTTLSGGTLRLAAAGAMPSGGNLMLSTLNSSLDLGNFNAAIGDLRGVGTIDKLSATTPTNTLSVASGDFWGTIRNTQGSLALNKTGSGTLVLQSDNTYTGGTTISGGTLQLGSGDTIGSVLGDVVNNGALAINRWASYTFNGAISGSGSVSVTQWGSGAVVLGHSNTYAGGTTVTAGMLRLGSAGALPVGNLSVNGTLDLSDYSATVKALTGSGVIDKQSATTPNNSLTAGSGAFSGVIRNTQGTLALVKSGSGTLVLSGANTYGGGTTIGGGTLSLDFSLAGAPAANILPAGSPLSLNGGNLVLEGNSSGTSTQTLGNVTVTAGSPAITVDSNSGAGTTLTLGAINSLPAGTALAFITTGAGPATVTTTTAPDAFGLYGTRITYNGDWAASASPGVPFTLSAYSGYAEFTQTSDNPAVNYSLTGSLPGPRSVSGSARTLKLNTSGSGQSLDLGSTTLTLAEGALLFAGANNYGITGGSLQGPGGAELLIHQLGAGALNVGSDITGTSSLTKSDAGLLVLSGHNSYSGGTTVAGGILQIDHTYSLPAGRSLTIAAGGTLVLSSGLSAAGGVSASAAPVPEPGTMALLAAAMLAGLAAWMRRRNPDCA